LLNEQPEEVIGVTASKPQEKKTEKDEEKAAGLYKYSIGRGNNALMVRSLFKNRFWWMIAEKGSDMERVNFMWT
jgi:hypothetical protein